MKFIDRSELEEKVAFRRTTTAKLEKRAGFPRRIKIGGKNYWILEQVEDWMRKQTAAQQQGA
jgi:predicted DNA-binding transcriptional regulator AlpA